MKYLLPYPLRAFCIQVAFHPFCWGLDCHNHRRTEFAKSQAETQWYLRLGCFTISYRRML